jgi:hypothetical protein
MTIIVHEPGILMTDSKRVMNPGYWDAYGGLGNKVVNCGEFAYATCGGDIRKEYVPWLEKAIRAQFFTWWVDQKFTQFSTNGDVLAKAPYKKAYRYWSKVYGNALKFPPARFDLIAMSKDAAFHIKRDSSAEEEKTWTITTDTKVLASSSLAYHIYRRAGQPPIEAIQSVIDISELCCGPVHFIRSDDLDDFDFDGFIEFLIQHEEMNKGEKE